MNETPAEFRLNPALDPKKLAAAFQQNGRLHIPSFLVAEDAARLHEYLRSSNDWRLVVNQGEKLFELDRNAQRSLTSQALGKLQAAVHAGARTGFQYWYESIRVPDDRQTRTASPTDLTNFAEFLCSAPVLSLMRQITGVQEVNFADAQATAYSPGHFLTTHHDEIEGKNRVAAYVFNLTPD